MNYARIERQMAPRTQRCVRELLEDPDVRYWKRVSAVTCVSSVATLATLLALAGAYAPAGPVVSAAPTERVAGPGHPGSL